MYTIECRIFYIGYIFILVLFYISVWVAVHQKRMEKVRKCDFLMFCSESWLCDCGRGKPVAANVYFSWWWLVDGKCQLQTNSPHFMLWSGYDYLVSRNHSQTRVVKWEHHSFLIPVSNHYHYFHAALDMIDIIIDTVYLITNGTWTYASSHIHLLPLALHNFSFFKLESYMEDFYWNLPYLLYKLHSIFYIVHLYQAFVQ